MPDVATKTGRNVKDAGVKEPAGDEVGGELKVEIDGEDLSDIDMYSEEMDPTVKIKFPLKWEQERVSSKPSGLEDEKLPLAGAEQDHKKIEDEEVWADKLGEDKRQAKSKSGRVTPEPGVDEKMETSEGGPASTEESGMGDEEYTGLKTPKEEKEEQQQEEEDVLGEPYEELGEEEEGEEEDEELIEEDEEEKSESHEEDTQPDSLESPEEEERAEEKLDKEKKTDKKEEGDEEAEIEGGVEAAADEVTGQGSKTALRWMWGVVIPSLGFSLLLLLVYFCVRHLLGVEKIFGIKLCAFSEEWTSGGRMSKFLGRWGENGEIVIFWVIFGIWSGIVGFVLLMLIISVYVRLHPLENLELFLQIIKGMIGGEM